MNMAMVKTIVFTVLALPSAALAQWTQNDLLNLIQGKNVQSVEELVPLLPEAYRANFTLVHKSKSIQQSSPDFPRVISYGIDGRLLISFNGHPQHLAYGTIETIQFKDNPPRFEPMKIFFRNAKKIPLGLQPAGSGAWVENNPRICAACHGSGANFHPILKTWSPSDNFGQWPGFYGHDGDRVQPGSEIHAWLDGFKNGPRKSGVYASLSINESLSKVAPYRESFMDPGIDRMPNTRLLGFITRYWAKAGAWRILTGPRALAHDAYLYLLLTVCDPRSIDPGLRKKVEEHIRGRHAQIPSQFKDSQILPYSINDWDPYASMFLQLREMDWWSRSLQSHQDKTKWLNWWGLSDGFSTLPAYEATEILKTLLPRDPQLRPYYSERPLPGDFRVPNSGHFPWLNAAGIVMNHKLAVGACPMLAERVAASLN